MGNEEERERERNHGTGAKRARVAAPGEMNRIAGSRQRVLVDR